MTLGSESIYNKNVSLGGFGDPVKQLTLSDALKSRSFCTNPFKVAEMTLVVY